MIKVKFLGANGFITGFEFDGHADESKKRTSNFFTIARFDVPEQDHDGKIICSAVSSAAYMTANTITDIMGICAGQDVGDGYMLLTLNEKDAQRAQDLLKGLELHIKSLAEQYPENIEVTYGGVSNA